MTSNERAITVLTEWLEAQPATAPEPLLNTVLIDLQTAPQRVRWRSSLRRFRLIGSNTLRFSIAAGALGVAVVLGYGLWASRPGGPGVQPSATIVSPATSSPTPRQTLMPTQVPSPTGDPLLDITLWTTYASAQYEFSIGHPADWTVDPADRAWEMDTDAPDWRSPAADDFIGPTGQVRVSAWSVPADLGPEFAGLAEVEAWIQDYCEKTDSVPCTGIHDRAVPLCLERRDCHPGLLVPFDEDVKAFFTNGAPGEDMTVVVVWRPETDLSVRMYGGARKLLEAFLSTMCVWPEDGRPPFDEPAPGC